jgi:DNA invertase Pin-like site-specific DNA recombinase
MVTRLNLNWFVLMTMLNPVGCRRVDLDGYIRVSRIGGRSGEGYISPDVQRQQIEEYAAVLGARIVEWHSDEDYSGGNTQRPGFQAALARIKAGDTGGLVVAHTDRFSRSVKDGAETVAAILEAGGLFASALERIDPTTPSGQYMLNTFLNNAELQLNTLKRSWVIAKERAVGRGAHIGVTPFGVIRLEDGTLVPDPDTAPVVVAGFEARLTPKGSYSGLLRLLSDLYPGRNWSTTGIRYMLQNRVYLGEVRHGDLVNTTALEPIVDRPLFDAVQATLTRRTYTINPERMLLAGLLECAACGRSLAGNRKKAADDVYRCQNSQCPGRAVITAPFIEAYVINEFKRMLAHWRIEGHRAGNRAGDIAAELAALDVEIDGHLTDLTLKRTLGHDRWRTHIEALTQQQETLRAEQQAEIAKDQTAGLTHLKIEDLSRDALMAGLRGGIDTVLVRSVGGPGGNRHRDVSDRVEICWVTDRREDPAGVSG